MDGSDRDHEGGVEIRVEREGGILARIAQNPGYDEQPDRKTVIKGYYFYQSAYYVTVSTNDPL